VEDRRRPIAARRTFLTLAWLANPLSYVAIYTLLAVMPDVATRLGLSIERVGLFCSVWFFARLVAFVVFWNWEGWHYRFEWLAASYVALLISFATIVGGVSLAVVVSAEIVFGTATGLIYYSSIFYSLDVGDAKAEHGGLHEAAIGAGIFAGPAIGSLSATMWPGLPHAGVLGVTVLLIAGFVVIVRVWQRSRRAA
jgi:hypothetical protein